MKVSSNSNLKRRRKLLYWLGGALSAIILWRFGNRETKAGKTVKMLTEDGTLVEVNAKHLTGAGRPAKPGEIQTWVKRKN
jgi:hypothetical protein